MRAAALPTLVRRLLVLVAALALLALFCVPAGAVPRPPGATPRTGPNTDLVMTGTGPGQGVTGGIGPVGGDFDPTDGYPASPPTGSPRSTKGSQGSSRHSR